MQILEIQNIEVKLARFTLRSSPKWIKLPKSTCFYERNRIMKKRKFEACSCQSCVEINANDANGYYPLRSMERIGSPRNIFTS